MKVLIAKCGQTKKMGGGITKQSQRERYCYAPISLYSCTSNSDEKLICHCKNHKAQQNEYTLHVDLNAKILSHALRAIDWKIWKNKTHLSAKNGGKWTQAGHKKDQERDKK